MNPRPRAAGRGLAGPVVKFGGLASVGIGGCAPPVPTRSRFRVVSLVVVETLDRV